MKLSVVVKVADLLIGCGIFIGFSLSPWYRFIKFYFAFDNVVAQFRIFLTLRAARCSLIWFKYGPGFVDHDRTKWRHHQSFVLSSSTSDSSSLFFLFFQRIISHIASALDFVSLISSVISSLYSSSFEADLSTVKLNFLSNYQNRSLFLLSAHSHSTVAFRFHQQGFLSLFTVFVLFDEHFKGFVPFSQNIENHLYRD